MVDVMLSKMKEYIDVIIPRGGKNLVRKVQELSKVPIIGHLANQPRPNFLNGGHGKRACAPGCRANHEVGSNNVVSCRML